MDNQSAQRRVRVVWVQDTDPRAPLQAVPAVEAATEDLWATGGKDCFMIRDLLADERCSQAVPDFLSTTDVGRRIPGPAVEDAQSTRRRSGNSVSRAKWKRRGGRRPRSWTSRVKDGRCPSPRLPSWPVQTRSRLRVGSPRAYCFCLSFVISLVRSIFLRTCQDGGQRGVP
jgi:hypothetical protein